MYDANSEAKQGAFAAEIDPTLVLFSDEAWFHVSGYVNSENNIYCSA
jgi:hypothetical protein